MMTIPCQELHLCAYSKHSVCFPCLEMFFACRRLDTGFHNGARYCDKTPPLSVPATT